MERVFIGIGGGVELCYDTVVGRRAECDDLPLPLYQQPYGDALYASGRELGPHLFPKQGRGGIARIRPGGPARGAYLLGIYQIHIDRAGRFDGCQNCRFGNFVENDSFGFGRSAGREPLRGARRSPLLRGLHRTRARRFWSSWPATKVPRQPCVCRSEFHRPVRSPCPD